MSAEERLIRYCKVDTQSDPYNNEIPSTEKQFDLANMLVEELHEMGIEDASVDDHCYVYAHLKANTDKKCQTVGFLAHMDTAPDYSGTNVNPRVIRNYDGSDITLQEGVVTRVEDFPYLTKCVGKTLIVTDGNTLLGADDKAGITAIMEALDYWLSHPEVEHGDIAIAFTPDEEVGMGPSKFDVKKFGASFAYTMDGGPIDVYSDETFNAAAAVVECTGLSIHPGSAKGHMINALNTAVQFHNMLPEHSRPEHTEGREPFFHLTNLNGNVDHATAEYIIRAHERNDFNTMKKAMVDAGAYLNNLYGTDVIDVKITDTYYNMKEILKDRPEVSGIAVKALAELGYTAENESVRGGTDGSQITFMGIPCPNLGTGGQNCHGRYEYCVVEEMEKAAELIVKIGSLTLQETAL